MRTVPELTAFMGIAPQQLVKTLIYVADDRTVAALVRGDHELNEAKFRRLLGAQVVEMADPATVARSTGAPMGFAGPVGLQLVLVADTAVKGMANFVTGGNRRDTHLRNVNPGRDFEVQQFGDLRVITPEDPCPRCGGRIHFGRGIEVGHVFKLGTKYSEALRAIYLDRNGKEIPILMGCYGIGIGRTLAAAIEQNHDARGVVFPAPLAPFEVIVLPLQMHEPGVVETAERLYAELRERNLEVLLDDRDERAGVKFNDADLLGIPVRVTVGLRGVREGRVEVKLRTEESATAVATAQASALIRETCERAL